MNDHLCELFTLSEIKDVAFQMGGMQAPSPDGFQEVFISPFGILLRKR